AVSTDRSYWLLLAATVLDRPGADLPLAVHPFVFPIARGSAFARCFDLMPYYFRSPCTSFSRSSSGATNPSVQRSVRNSTAPSCSSPLTSETPSSSARRMSASRLGVKILLRFGLPCDIWHVLMAAILLGTNLSNAVPLVSTTCGQRHRVTQPRKEELL